MTAAPGSQPPPRHGGGAASESRPSLLELASRMPPWLRVLGLVTLAHGLLLHPLITSMAFELDLLWQPDDLGPEDFPLAPDTPLVPPREGLDLGVVSALGVAALATAFAVGCLVVARRRSRPAGR